MEEVKKNINMDEIIEQLKAVVTSKVDDNGDEDSNKIIKILDDFLEGGGLSFRKNSFEENFKLTIDDVNVFSTLLTHKSNVIVTRVTSTIAEIARTKEGREKFTQNELVKLLLNLLKKDDVELVIQTCRALGNICYENTSGNKIVRDHDGLNLALEVIKKSVNIKDEEAEFLRSVSAAFFLNLLSDQTADLEQEILDRVLIPIFCDILEIDGVTGRNSATHVLLVLENLNDDGRKFLNERLAKVLINILDVDISTELSELCLTLLQGQAEHGDTKLLLAKLGVCESLLKLLEKYVSECVNEESRVVLKGACDFVVTIMTGEESMNLLYAESNGTVYKKLVDWLIMDKCDQDLQLTAVLAMGNFATSDAHCQQMVENGIHKHLFRLLSINRGVDGNIRLQHALLSAVRNLVISPRNKQVMLADGVIDIVYPMLEIKAFPVVFKLLGTLRIVIDGQEEAAISLGMRNGLLKRAVELCNTDLHLGVQAEANRLIAWLIINSRNKELICSLIDHGGISHLVKMITVSQALMQNEALMSLTIIAAMALKECEEQLISSNIGKTLDTFVTVSGPCIELPIVENSLTFINTIIKSDTIKKHLKGFELLDGLKKLKEEKKTWTEPMREKMKTIDNSLSN